MTIRRLVWTPASARCALAAAALLAAGCPGAPPEAPPKTATASAPVGGTAEGSGSKGCDPQPVPDGDFELLGDPRACIGGRIVLEKNSYPTHLNYYGPERDNDIARIYTEAMFNTLIQIHPSTLQIVPELASTWEEEDGGRRLTFHLDPDAKWSDGTPITSKDVLATWDLMYAPEVVETSLKVELDSRGFKRPVALDDRTVRFDVEQASWRNIIVFDDLYIYPAHAVDPKTYLEQWRFAVPVVSGEYTLGEYESGKFFVLKRRPDFWGWGKRQFIGTGNFDEIYHKIIFNNDTAWEAMKKGDIDFFLISKAKTWVEETEFDKVQKGWIQKMKMFHREPQVPSQMAFSLTHPIFSDVRVRKAMFYLMDREYLHDQLFYNQYTDKDSYFANSVYENPGNEKIRFDPEKGVALLAEAGWSKKDADGTLVKDGRRFEFTFLYIHPDAARVYTPLQETFRKYGIKVNLELIQPSAWIKVTQEKEFELIYANWGSTSFPTLREMWHSSSADQKDTSNITRFKDPRVDALIEQYEAEPSLAKRAAIVQQADAIIYAQYPYLLDWYSDNYRIMWWDKFGMPDWVSYAGNDIRYMLWRTWWHEQPRADRLQAAIAAGTAVPRAPAENRWWKDGPGAKFFVLPAQEPAAPGAASGPTGPSGAP